MFSAFYILLAAQLIALINISNGKPADTTGKYYSVDFREWQIQRERKKKRPQTTYSFHNGFPLIHSTLSAPSMRNVR